MVTDKKIIECLLEYKLDRGDGYSFEDGKNFVIKKLKIKSITFNKAWKTFLQTAKPFKVPKRLQKRLEESRNNTWGIDA